MKTRTGNLFKRNGIYYVRWRVNGKLFMRSTGETQLKEAKKKREEILAPFVAGREVDVLRNVSARIEGRTAEIEQWQDRENPPLTIADAWTAYLKALNRPDSGGETLRQYKSHYDQFARWVEQEVATVATLRDVTREIAEQYAQHLVSRGLSANRFNKHVNFLALLFRVLHDKTAVTRRIQKHFTDCGIPTLKPGTGPGTGKRAVVDVGFHSLRHTFVSLCREANAPLAVVEAIVGHANPAMTRHYTHVGEAAATTAVAALPDIIGTAKPALPASDTVTIPAATLRELAEQLTAERAVEVRAQLLALLGGIQAG